MPGKGGSVPFLALPSREKPAQREKAGGFGVAVGDPGVERAVGFVVAAGAGAALGAGFEVGEGVDDAGGVDVVEAEGADAGGVDDPAVVAGEGRASAEVVVWRPRPVTALTPPVAR